MYAVRRALASCSLTLMCLAGCPAPTAAAAESTDPIKIALFDWTSVNLNAKILGGILTKLGYTVEYPTTDYLSSLTTGLHDTATSPSAWNSRTRRQARP